MDIPIAQRIKDCRNGKRYSQAKLAEMIGMSTMTIRRWEKGERAPTADNLPKLAEVLNTSTSYLLGESNNPTPLNNSSQDTEDSVKGNVQYPPADTDMVNILLVDGVVSVCCGGGNAYPDEVEWNIIGTFPVVRSMLNGLEWRLRDGGYHVIRAESDSMEPRIHDGDYLFFADVDVSSGEIAIVKYREHYLVRGVFFEKKDIHLKAQNKLYETIVVTPDDIENEDFFILGKVVSRMGSIEKVQPML